MLIVIQLLIVTPADVGCSEEPQPEEEGRELGPEVGGDEEGGGGGEAGPEQALGQAGQTEQLLLGEQSQVGGGHACPDPAAQEEAGQPRLPRAREAGAGQLSLLPSLQQGRQRPGASHARAERQESSVMTSDE